MQNLAIEDYLKLCKVYLELYDKQKISEYGLLNVVMPNFLEKKIIIDNYKNPDVINFLKIMKDKEKRSSEFKGHIENILSGNR